MTALGYLLLVVGGLALLGALLPGTRVAPGRFSRTDGPRMPRVGRIGLALVGLAAVGVGMRCARG